MPDTFQAVLVFIVALLPGALYVWNFERQVGNFGLGASDRVLRFIGGSAAFFSLGAWPLYWLYTSYWERLAAGDSVPRLLALVPPAYVAIPSVVGLLVGGGVRNDKPWAIFIVGTGKSPRAWDFLFRPETNGWVRCRLKSKTWLGGAFATDDKQRSYAATYPEPQDLYLARGAKVDPRTGEFLLGDDGAPLLYEGGLLIRWGEIEYLEFVHAKGASTTGQTKKTKKTNSHSTDSITLTMNTEKDPQK